MPAPSYDLLNIIATLQKKRRLVIIITLLAAVAGGVFHSFKKKKYKADARFLVNNPLYGDRNSLFRNIETRYVDYFGGDDDLDRVTSFFSSDTVRDRIIRNCQFQEIYKADINDPKQHGYLMDIFNKNFNLKRTEYKDMVVSYIAYDPQTAANVANMSVQVLEETFRNYYTVMKQNMLDAIAGKIYELDSNINKYTDSLSNMRERTGIYNIVSPGRQNIISPDVKNSGKGTGRAIEELQNIESIKDQLVTDRAKYISIKNEFEVSASAKMKYIKLITRAVAPSNPSGLSLTVTIMICASLGFLFSACWVLIKDYYQLLMAATRS